MKLARSNKWSDELDQQITDNRLESTGHDDIEDEESISWITTGIDVYRFEVGTFQPERDYPRQFRLKIDPINCKVNFYFHHYSK
jgi:hypothetical protein